MFHMDGLVLWVKSALASVQLFHIYRLAMIWPIAGPHFSSTYCYMFRLCMTSKQSFPFHQSNPHHSIIVSPTLINLLNYLLICSATRISNNNAEKGAEMPPKALVRLNLLFLWKLEWKSPKPAWPYLNFAFKIIQAHTFNVSQTLQLVPF